MSHLFFIAANNAKKQKGDIITLALLAFLSSFILYIGLSVIAGTSRMTDRIFEEHNSAHVYYWVPEVFADDLEDMFSTNENVGQFDRSRADLASVKYRNPANSSSDWSSYQMLFGSFGEERTINTLGTAAEGLAENDVLVPYGIKTEYAIGDTIEFEIGNRVCSYTVAGYVMDPLFASALGMPVYNIYMSDNALDTLLRENGDCITEGSSLKMRGIDGMDSEELHRILWDDYSKWMAQDPARNESSVLEVSWEVMRSGGTFMLKIVMAMITAFAVIIMAIAMIIISFSIRNFIDRNLKNTGILEAAGYTTRELSMAVIIENAVTALIGSVTGVAVAGGAQKAVGDVVALTSGYEWNMPYDYTVAALTAAGIVLVVILVCLAATRRYAKIPVLECLRGGIGNHNFKRNHFSFENTSLPVPLTLSLKELFGDKARNIVLAAIVVILAVATNLGFALLSTYGNDVDAILELGGMEAPDITFTDARGLSSDAASVTGVDRVLMYYQIEPTFVNGDNRETVSCDVYDDLSGIEHEMVIEGRLPQSDHEVILTKMIADKLGVVVGDIVYIEYGDARYDYIVTGFDQKINHAGLKGMLTDEGVQRFLGATEEVTYYVYASEGYDYDSLKDGISGITDASLDDGRKMVTETISAVSDSMYVICLVILACTALVVVFVEVLLVRSKIIRERRNYGVNKALGFTSGQLMVQTMISNIPSIIIGCLIGYVISTPATRFVTNMPLKFFGMSAVDISVPLYGMVITLTGILVVALATAFVCSLAIRKVEPVELLSEE